jgi:hypothetical protein
MVLIVTIFRAGVTFGLPAMVVVASIPVWPTGLYETALVTVVHRSQLAFTPIAAAQGPGRSPFTTTPVAASATRAVPEGGERSTLRHPKNPLTTDEYEHCA